jgi:hypothetical protein
MAVRHHPTRRPLQAAQAFTTTPSSPCAAELLRRDASILVAEANAALVALVDVNDDRRIRLDTTDAIARRSSTLI